MHCSNILLNGPNCMHEIEPPSRIYRAFTVKLPNCAIWFHCSIEVSLCKLSNRELSAWN